MDTCTATAAIAFFIGFNTIFDSMTIKNFEKRHFSISKLRVIDHGMPERYKSGLTNEKTN